VPSKAASPTIRRKIGARIRALREEAGLTQEAVAWASGLSKPHLSRVESGENLPSVAALVRIARELGVEPADLLAYDLRNPRVRLFDAARRADAQSLRDAMALITCDASDATRSYRAPVPKRARRQRRT
jgi:transcriptional regulator with XRE-family HTH domain